MTPPSSLLPCRDDVLTVLAVWRGDGLAERLRSAIASSDQRRAVTYVVAARSLCEAVPIALLVNVTRGLEDWETLAAVLLMHASGSPLIQTFLRTPGVTALQWATALCALTVLQLVPTSEQLARARALLPGVTDRATRMLLELVLLERSTTAPNEGVRALVFMHRALRSPPLEWLPRRSVAGDVA